MGKPLRPLARLEGAPTCLHFAPPRQPGMPKRWDLMSPTQTLPCFCRAISQFFELVRIATVGAKQSRATAKGRLRYRPGIAKLLGKATPRAKPRAKQIEETNFARKLRASICTAVPVKTREGLPHSRKLLSTVTTENKAVLSAATNRP